MKNFKIRMKILLSFGIVISMTLVFVAFVIISNTTTINNVEGMRVEAIMQSLSSNIGSYFSQAITGADIISLSFNDSQYTDIVKNIEECDKVAADMEKLISDNASLSSLRSEVDSIIKSVDSWSGNVAQIQALNKDLEAIINNAHTNQLALTEQSMGIFDYQMELSTNEASQEVAEESRLRRVSRIQTGMDIATKLNYIGNSFEVMFKSLDTSSVEEDKKILAETVEVLEAFLAESTLQYNIDTATSMLIALKTYEDDIDNFIDCLSKRNDLIKTVKQNGSSTLSSINNMIKNIESSSLGYADTTLSSANWSLIIIIVFAAFGLILSMLLAIYLSAIISRPLITIATFLKQAGSTGDMKLKPEDAKNIGQISQRRDEIGDCSNSLTGLMSRIQDVSVSLETIADGDLTSNIALLSEHDTMGRSLQKMVGNLNVMFGDIRVSSEQVQTGSGQVSQSAQELASGSSEQAASIEELSATVAEVREQVDSNAERSQKALLNCETTGALMASSMESMKQMLEAMDAIGESSKNITRVINVIDDIAFQTNILALNAAVEAARAGQHGKGFAVVADEVRNLAAKSADAAKETASLIEGSSARVSEGSRIVERTNEGMKAVGVTTEENAELIRYMAQSLNRQKTSIIEINQGMEQISTVVQANAATAEQSAAAAQELSAQSVVMNNIVGSFKLKQSGHASYNIQTYNGSETKERYSDGFALAGNKY